MLTRVHSSVWIEWLPAEQLVEGSNPSGPASILVLFSGFHKIKGEKKKLESPQSIDLDPWSLYIYAMKAPMTRDRYKTRLAKFLHFIGNYTQSEDRQANLPSEDKARILLKKERLISIGRLPTY